MHYVSPETRLNGLDSFAPYSALIQRTQATKASKATLVEYFDDG